MRISAKEVASEKILYGIILNKLKIKACTMSAVSEYITTLYIVVVSKNRLMVFIIYAPSITNEVYIKIKMFLYQK